MAIKGFIAPNKLEELVINKLQEKGITKRDYPFDPYELIRSEGIILNEVPLSNDNIKGMLVNGPNQSGIMINKNRCYVSKRFIAMHELSHFWFHKRQNERVCLEEYTNNHRSEEWQANNAAAYALMPKDVIALFYDLYCGDSDLIASELRVSKESALIRLKELGLEPAKKTIRFSYSFFNEPDRNFIALENSYLYGNI